VTKRIRSPWLMVLTLFLIYPTSGMGIDVYVPSMPAMSYFFQVPSSLVKLSITFYLLGYALFCFIIPPLSDSFGRRPFLLVGLLVFAIVSFAITKSPNIEILLVLRFIQGVCMASIMGIARAILPDLFEGEKYKKITNYCVAAWAIGPIIAPFIGSNLQHYFSWRAPFYFLGTYVLVVFFLVLFYLPESLHNRHPFEIIKVSQNIWTVMKCPIFYSLSILSGLCYSAFLLFSTLGPFAIQVDLGYSPRFFGWMALLMGAAYFLGSLVPRFLEGYKERHVINTLSLLFCLLAMTALLVSLETKVNIYLVVVSSFVMIFIAAAVFPMIYAKALNMFRHQTGVVSAVLGGYLLLISSLTTLISSLLACPYVSIAVEMIGFYVLLSLLVIFFYQRIKKNEFFTP